MPTPMRQFDEVCPQSGDTRPNLVVVHPDERRIDGLRGCYQA